MNEIRIALENIERDCKKCISNCKIPPCCLTCSMYWAKEALKKQLSENGIGEGQVTVKLHKCVTYYRKEFEWFKCDKCLCDAILNNFTFCPTCGKKINWEGGKIDG